jgi:hypothetical protein
MSPSIEESLADLLERLTPYTEAPPADGYLDDLIASLFDRADQEDDLCLLSVSLDRRAAGWSPSHRDDRVPAAALRGMDRSAS